MACELNAEQAPRDPLSQWTEGEREEVRSLLENLVTTQLGVVVVVKVQVSGKLVPAGVVVAARNLSRHWRVWMLYVRPKYRQMGLGGRLYSECARQIRLHGGAIIEFETGSPELMAILNARGWGGDSVAQVYRRRL